MPDLFNPAPRWRPPDFDAAKLTTEERALLNQLRFHVGRARAILVAELAHCLGNVDPRKIREILKHLRDNHGIAIGSAVSSPAGIFLIETIEEYKDWRDQEKGRALSILRGIALREKVTLPELCGQMALEVESRPRTGDRA